MSRVIAPISRAITPLTYKSNTKSSKALKTNPRNQNANFEQNLRVTATAKRNKNLATPSILGSSA